MSQTDRVYRNPHVYPLFVSDQESMGVAIGQLYFIVSITERAREYVNSLSTHLGTLCNPKMIPKGLIGGIRNACIKSHLLTVPSLALADRLCKRDRIVVWEAVSERPLCTVKKILAVKETYGSDRGRRLGHWEPMAQKAEPRQRPIESVSSGEEIDVRNMEPVQ
jgi:hypothetical protein